MPKVLGQAGTSLADVYDVEGSIAGVEQLLSKDVSLTHDMGETIFSERFSTTIRRVASSAIAQSTVFTATMSDLPTVPFRILGVQVLTSVTSRINDVCVNMNDPVAVREFPIWVWDGTNETVIRFIDDGSLADQIALNPVESFGQTPIVIAGSSAPQSTPNLFVRGTTSAFGAGTVTVRAIVFVAFAQTRGINSRGLPIPSW